MFIWSLNGNKLLKCESFIVYNLWTVRRMPSVNQLNNAVLESDID